MEDRANLRISTRNHIDALSSSLFFTIVFFAAVAWVRFDRTAVIIALVLYWVDLIPALILHIEYWIENRGQEVLVDENELVIKSRSEEKVIKAKEIRKITMHQTPSHSQNSNMRFMTIGSYYFAHIYFKNGEGLILTSLLSHRLKASLRKLKGVYFDEDVSLYNNLYRAFSILMVASVIKEGHKFYDIAFDLVDQGSLGSNHTTPQAGLFTGGWAKMFLGF